MIPDASREPQPGYERFFGFEHTPFSIAPDTRFRFQSASHAAALSQITYALERREPVVVVTGEIGTGKTLLCRTVVERLERRTFLSIINDPLIEPDALLKQMLQDFGVVSRDRSKSTAASRHDLIHALQEFLASLAALHAHAVVIIDEAQHVQPEVLEHVRLVSNIQDGRGTMLQIILVGQTDLEQLLSRSELRPLKQRVSRTVRLDALTAAEVAQYIAHRLSVARERPVPSSIPGAWELQRELAEWDRSNSNAPFTEDAISAVAQLSRGIPRVVNLLCDRALETAYERQLRTVDASLINPAATLLGLIRGAETTSPVIESPEPLATPQFVSTAVPVVGDPLSPAMSSQARRYAIAIALIVLVGAAIWLGARASNRRDNVAPSPPIAAATEPAANPAATPPVPPARSGSESPAATATSALSPVPQPTGTAATTANSTGEAFEIVVASFHTAARATKVADDVTALGEPVRQRIAGGWRQVLAGPYTSAVQARDAQQRLERAGFGDTKVVVVVR